MRTITGGSTRLSALVTSAFTALALVLAAPASAEDTHGSAGTGDDPATTSDAHEQDDDQATWPPGAPDGGVSLPSGHGRNKCAKWKRGRPLPAWCNATDTYPVLRAQAPTVTVGGICDDSAACRGRSRPDQVEIQLRYRTWKP